MYNESWLPNTRRNPEYVSRIARVPFQRTVGTNNVQYRIMEMEPDLITQKTLGTTVGEPMGMRRTPHIVTIKNPFRMNYLGNPGVKDSNAKEDHRQKRTGDGRMRIQPI